MANSLNDVIRKLEQQRAGIERALAALREIEGMPVEPSAAESSSGTHRGKRRSRMTPEGRRRLSEALKKRWAAKRAGAKVGTTAAAPAKAARKGGMTPEGRKRLSEALKKRWAAKRAAAAKRK